MLYEVTISVILFVHAVLAGDKVPVKIVNSTNIKELKLSVPDEDKSGAVAYVYAVESSELITTEAATTKGPDQSEEKTSKEKKPSSSKHCVTRVIEKMKGDERTVAYNATAEEAKSAGKNIIDSICEGDERYQEIIKVNLANLKDDIYHLP